MICKYCEAEFNPKTGNQEYCSSKCSGNYRYNRKRKREITPVNGQAQLISKEWPRGYGIYHWGEIRETAEYGSWPADAVFVDVNDSSVRFKIQSNSQTTYDPEIVSPQTLVRVESE